MAPEEQLTRSQISVRDGISIFGALETLPLRRNSNDRRLHTEASAQCPIFIAHMLRIQTNLFFNMTVLHPVIHLLWGTT
jgi:hypothetical protein